MEAKDNGYYWHGQLESEADKFTMNTSSTNIQSSGVYNSGYLVMFGVDVSKMEQPTLQVVGEYYAECNIYQKFDIETGNPDTAEGKENIWMYNNGEGDTYDLTEVVSKDEDKLIYIEYKKNLTDVYVYDAANYITSVTNNNQILEVDAGKTVVVDVGSYTQEGTPNILTEISQEENLSASLLSLIAENGEIKATIKTENISYDDSISFSAKVAGVPFVIAILVKKGSGELPSVPSDAETKQYEAKDGGYYWHGQLESENNEYTMSTSSTNMQSSGVYNSGYLVMFGVDVSKMEQPTLQVIGEYYAECNIYQKFDIETGNPDTAEGKENIWMYNNGEGDTYDLTEIVSKDEDKLIYIEYKKNLTDVYVYDAANYITAITNNNKLIEVVGGEVSSVEVGAYECQGTVQVPTEIVKAGPIKEASLVAKDGKILLSLKAENVDTDTKMQLTGKVAGDTFIVYLVLKAASGEIPSTEPIPTSTPTKKPSRPSYVIPTATPTIEPTASPTIAPTATPTAAPTVTPTAVPTIKPTVAPTGTPTPASTIAPTAAPTIEPTTEPTTEPTVKPTEAPVIPTKAPAEASKVQKGDKVTVSGQKYVVTNASQKTVSYVAAKNSKKTVVSVPATVKVKVNGKNVTYKVTSIQEKAFKSNKKLKKITVNKNIKSIGKEAFKNCSNLKTIVIKSSSITKVGKDALKGTAKNLVIKVPAKKASAYKKLFKNKGNSSVVIKKI